MSDCFECDVDHHLACPFLGEEDRLQTLFGSQAHDIAEQVDARDLRVLHDLLEVRELYVGCIGRGRSR